MGYIALVLLLGFFAGVLIESLYALGVWAVVLCALLAIMFLVLKLLRKTQAYLLATLFLIAAMSGVVRVMVVPDALPSPFVSLLETGVTFEGKVVSDPDVRESTNRLTLLVERGGEETKILAVTPPYPSVRLGDTVSVSGTLVSPEPFDTDGGRVFRYDQYLAKDGIFAVVERASLSVVSQRSGVLDHLRGFFSDIKFAGIDALSVALPEPHASLAAGLLLGGKQGLGEKLLDDFIRSGLVHIVVLSGYNVMIVAEFVMRSFGFLTKRYAAIAAGIVIFGFVLAAGAGAASIRAGLMAGIALFGRATGRTYDAFRALCLAGFVMVLINPYVLVYDPGFQLSFVATLGLLFGAPIIERRLGFIKRAFLREVVASTIAAQVAVLPLLLFQNGLLSFVSFPANVLILPFVPFAMLASFIALIAGAIAPFAAPFLALPAYALLSFIIGAVQTASALPFAAVTVPAFSFIFVILGYATLGVLLWRNYVTASR